MRYALSDAEWRLIEPILPCKPRGVPRVDDLTLSQRAEAADASRRVFVPKFHR